MVRGLVAWAFFKVGGFEVWARVFDSRSKGSRFCRLGCFGSRRVQGLGACFRFEIEGFEVWSPGNFLKSKGSKFGRVCSIQDRRVRSFVAWATQTLHDNISLILHSFQKPSISLFNPLSNRAFPDPDSPGPYFLDLAILPGTTNFVCSLEC